MLVNKLGKILAFNRATKTLLGYPRVNHLNTILDETVTDFLDRVRKGKKIVTTFRTVRGKELLIVRAVPHNNGPRPLFLLFLTDNGLITRLKKSHELLEYAEELAEIGSFEVNLVNQQSKRSKGLKKLLGLPEDNTQSGIKDFMSRVHPDDQSLVKESLVKFKAGVESQYWEFRLFMPGGGLKAFKAYGKLYCDLHGQPEKVIGVVADVAKRRQRETESLTAVINAQENERATIAREIHDGLGPSVASIKMYFEHIKPFITQAEKAHKWYNEIIEVLDELHKNLRDFSHRLLPKTLSDFGLGPAVESLCDRLERNADIKVTYSKNGIIRRFNQAKELNCYRVIQEIVSNTIAHASACHLNLEITYYESSLEILVEDDGVGFEVNKEGREGIGLLNIRSRIRALDGSVNIHSAPNQGTIFKIKIPIYHDKNHSSR